MRARRALVALAAAAVLGCNPLVLLSESEQLGGLAREALIEDCCFCLSSAVVFDAEEGCPVEGDVEDAGLLGLDEVSPCLCGLDREGCVERLSGGGAVVVVGACVRRGAGRDGPCAGACGGVLAFPEEDGAQAP